METKIFGNNNSVGIEELKNVLIKKKLITDKEILTERKNIHRLRELKRKKFRK